MGVMRLRWRDEVPGLAVFICTLIVYLALVPPYVMGGDSGEFALLAHAPGIAHPPGYPLYVGILRLLHWLPAATPAQAAGYATALIGSAQTLVLYFACRAWGAPSLAAAVSVGFYAASPLAVRHFTHAEVFALNGLIVAAILCVCAPIHRLNPLQRLSCLALLCGLGCAHHHSFVLLAPLIVYGLLRDMFALGVNRRAGALALVFVFFLLGFSVNLLLIPWSRLGGVYLQSWGVIRDWSDFWHHFLRRDYGTFNLAVSSGSRVVPFPVHLQNLFQAIMQGWKFLLPFAAVAFVVRLRGVGIRESRGWAWLSLLLSFLLAGPVFLLRANIEPTVGFPSSEVLQRFYLLPSELLALPVAEGVAIAYRGFRRIASRSSSRQSLDWPWLQAVLPAVIAIYAFAFNVFLSIRHTSLSRGSYTQDFVVNSLGSLPRNSIAVLGGDDEMFAGSYLQRVEGFRPDVVVVNATFLTRPWYPPRLSKRLPGCRWPEMSVVGFFEHLVQRCDRQLFVSLTEDGSSYVRDLYSRNPNYQYGLFRHVLPPGVKPPSAEAVFAMNERLFASFAMPERRVSLAHGWASSPSLVYAFAWQAIARDMARDGRPDLAAAAALRARQYGFCREGDCLSD